MIQLGSLLIQPILTRDRVIYTKMGFGGEDMEIWD